MKKLKHLILICVLFTCCTASAQINENTKPIANTLERYQPIPSDIMEKAQAINNAILQRNRILIADFMEYYNSITVFKPVQDGSHRGKVILGSSLIMNSNILVANNKIESITLNKTYNSQNGLKVSSIINNGRCKIFLVDNEQYTAIEVYILDSFE